MSDSCFDDRYTKVVKPTASYTIVPKATASYTIVEEPCFALLSILTEHSIEILHEDSRRMVREG